MVKHVSGRKKMQKASLSEQMGSVYMYLYMGVQITALITISEY